MVQIHAVKLNVLKHQKGSYTWTKVPSKNTCGVKRFVFSNCHYHVRTLCFHYSKLKNRIWAISNKMANFIKQAMNLKILARSIEVMYASIRYQVYFHT